MASERQQSDGTWASKLNAPPPAHTDSAQGAICLDTLSTPWSPVLTIKSALLSLQSLLSTPEPKDPQDAEVAKMLMRNPKEFHRVAAEWAVLYAGAPKRERGETSGGATPETMKKRQKKSKEQEEAERVAQYVLRKLKWCFVLLTKPSKIWRLQ